VFSHLKRLGGDSLLYALMNVGTKIIAFVMFPIYTYYIPDPAEYGILDIVERITSMLTFLVIFGTDSALAFYYYDTEDEEKRLNYIKQVLLFRLTFVSVFVILIAIGGSWISTLLFDNSGLAHLLYIGIAALFLDTIVTLILTVLRYQFKTVKVVLFTVLKMLLVAVLSYLLLATLIPSIEGILIARVVSGVIIFIFVLKYFMKFFTIRIDKKVLKEVLIYAAPLVPASLFFWIIINANVLFLKEFTTYTEVGIYSTALKFATTITLLTSGVQMAWRPFSMSLKDKTNSSVVFSKLYMGILLLGSVGIILIATMMPWVIQILGDNYEKAYIYVAPLAAVTFLNFYYLIISVGLFFSKKTKYVSIAFGISALVNIVLNLILIPLLGTWGAVLSYLLSYVIAIVLIFKKSQKYYFVPISFTKMSFIFCNMLVTIALIIYVQINEFSWIYVLLAWIYFIVSTVLVRVDKDLFKQPNKHVKDVSR
jgi:O-antigen/teichoic acid export membrane protein